MDVLVLEALGPTILSDKITTRLGWLCSYNENYRIGPKYLVSFNYPKTSNEEKYICQFIRSSPKELIIDFYKNSNGMKIFNNYFYIPGVGLHGSDIVGLEYYNIPYDFQVSGGIDLPKMSPYDGFVIGVSKNSIINSYVPRIYDIVDGDGCIISGMFGEESNILEKFNDWSDWIFKRVHDARNFYLSEN